MATDLVRRRVAVIAALGSSAQARGKSGNHDDSDRFQTGANPVEDGLVASINRPGGNITGASRMNIATDAKRLEILHETVPNAVVIACLVNPTSPRSGSQVQQLQNSTRSLGLKLQIVNASNDQDLEAAFATVAQVGAAALFVTADPSMNAMREQIASRAVRHSLPTMSDTREWVNAGGLMSYDASLADSNLKPASMLVAFSKVKNSPIFRFCNQLILSLSSISRQRRYSESKFRENSRARRRSDRIILSPWQLTVAKCRDGSSATD